jgi:chromosome segregation ATPase
MLFFSPQTPLGMPKKNGIPKSLLADLKSVKTRLSGLERPKAILADIGSLKTRLGSLEKAHTSVNKELKSISDALKRQESTIAQLGKKPAKKEKRKPSEYNLFLKDKMSAGMSMIDAVKAWKEKEGGSSSSSMKQPGQDWQSPSQQY